MSKSKWRATAQNAGDDPINGILNVNKPLGLTSHDVVDQIRQMTGQHKVGHAGTLDPLATGVLLICLGQATRVSQYLMDSSKTYLATICLGISTTTCDAEGQIVSEKPVNVARSEVATVLERFVGCIAQVPPMHSAIKQKGKTLYRLARRGIEVERQPRKVSIFQIGLIDWIPPTIQIQVECGPGTYIRALARDLGEALDCGAHLAALQRMRSGHFKIEQAASLEQLEMAFNDGTYDQWLHPLDAAFDDLPDIHLDGKMAHRLSLGQAVSAGQHIPVLDMPPISQARAYDPAGQLIALVEWDSQNGAWRPHKVFVKPEIIHDSQCSD